MLELWAAEALTDVDRLPVPVGPTVEVAFANIDHGAADDPDVGMDEELMPLEALEDVGALPVPVGGPTMKVALYVGNGAEMEPDIPTADEEAIPPEILKLVGRLPETLELVGMLPVP